jgi:hypothetical protein
MRQPLVIFAGGGVGALLAILGVLLWNRLYVGREGVSIAYLGTYVGQLGVLGAFGFVVGAVIAIKLCSRI